MRRRLVWALLVATSVLFVAAVIWGALTDPSPPTLNQIVWICVMVPAPVVAGAYLMRSRPDNSIGELLALSAICFLVVPTTLELPTVSSFQQSGVADWMWAPIWLSQTLIAVGAVLTIACFVVIPDGRIRFARERRLVSIAWVTVTFPTLALLSNELVQTDDLSFPGVAGIQSPAVVDWLRPYGSTLATVSSVGFLLIVVAIAFLYMRYRSASTHERKQIRWVLFGGAVALLIAGTPYALSELGVTPGLDHGAFAALLSALAILPFYASLVVAVTDPSWVDVDFVIRKSFVYGVLSFLILLLYIGAAAAFGVVAAENRLGIEIAVTLTVVVAILFQPARRHLQEVADRWVFGARPTGYEAVTEFGETIEEVADPTELLPRMAETIRKAVRMEWVAVTLDDGTRATSGSVRDPTILSFPIGAGGEVVGTIDCGPKIGRAIEDDEKHLIQTLAAQVGAVVMNARLAGRIVNAAEAERRRIERNIHDGAQQELVALVARLGMARTKAANGALSAEELDDLRGEAQRILSELRELAQGIHPTVLADGGLLEAVEDKCSHLPLTVSLHASGWPRAMRFHDDVEGAAYFFVSESLANVLKHSGADTVEVTLAREGDSILLTVTDNGCGINPEASGLNGLSGLSDRIRALGGSMSVSRGDGGGTSVRAELPAGTR